MKFAIATGRAGASRRSDAAARRPCQDAFTLVEVLAAMLFMAIVVPVAVDALHIASLAGEIGARKAEAARVADAVLNENIVTTNWNQSALSGTSIEGGHEYRWTLRNQLWPDDSTMQLLTVEVNFSAGGRQSSVQLNTLVNSTTGLGASLGGMQ